MSDISVLVITIGIDFSVTAARVGDIFLRSPRLCVEQHGDQDLFLSILCSSLVGML